MTSFLRGTPGAGTVVVWSWTIVRVSGTAEQQGAAAGPGSGSAPTQAAAANATAAATTASVAADRGRRAAGRHATRGVHRAGVEGDDRAAARSSAVSIPSTNALDEGRVELAPGRVLEPVQRLPDVERLAVRPRRRHRRERVADREDPGDQRDLLAGEPVEVAVAVPALVVVADPGPDRARRRAGRGRSRRPARRAA